MNSRQVILILLALLLLLTTGVVLAQQPGPPRDVEREAPELEAMIVEREVAAPDATNVTVAIPAEADAYIASERPNRNFGDEALFLGFNNVGDRFGAQRPLLRFDIAGNIPSGVVVNEARLGLRLSFAAPADDAPMPTIVRNLRESWDESNVTWNNQPTWGSVYAQAPVGSALEWYEWEVTELVRAWEEGSLPNHGLEIIGDEEIQERERAFYSRETTTDYYPHLLVTYTEAGDTEPPVILVDPLPAYSPRTFTVSWSGSDQGDPASGIAYYDVQYQVDGGEWTTWLEDVTIMEADFTGESGRQYGFRARGVDEAGNVEDYGGVEATTTVDSSDPVTTVIPLPTLTDQSAFTVSWRGSDGDGAGIAFYDVRYRFAGGGWQIWQQQTLATSVTFTAMNDGLYQFEARATDELGNQEPFQGEPEASIMVDAEAPFVQPRLWLPVIIH